MKNLVILIAMFFCPMVNAQTLSYRFSNQVVALLLDFQRTGNVEVANKYDIDQDGTIHLFGFNLGNGNPIFPYKVKNTDNVIFIDELQNATVFFLNASEVNGYYEPKRNIFIWTQTWREGVELADGRTISLVKSKASYKKISDSGVLFKLNQNDIFEVSLQNESTGKIEMKDVIALNDKYMILKGKNGRKQRVINSNLRIGYDGNLKEKIMSLTLKTQRLIADSCSIYLTSN